MSEEKKPVAKVKVSFGSVAAPKAVKETEKKEEPKKAAAPEKKTTVKKSAAKKPAAAPKAEEKPAPVVGEVKTVTAKAETSDNKETKKEDKEMTAKKTETKKAPVEKKAPAKKPVAEKKAPAAKKVEIKTEVVLQWNGQDYSTDRLVQSAKDVWQYDLGRNVDEIKELQVYAKPEEGKAYAVVNGIDELSFDI